MLRILKTTKPIPSAVLKAGRDNGAYDQTISLWLPGNTVPVKRPDLKWFNGRQGAPKAAAQPVPRGPGLWVARQRLPKVSDLVIAKR